MTIDTAGAEEFARTRMDSLRRFAYLICGSAVEADDLAQIAVIEVWRRWRTAGLNPEAYARRVIVTRNVSRWRRRRREVPVDAADADPHEGARRSRHDHAARRSDDPASREVTNPALWQALRGLGDAERAVVVLHVLYEYTFNEIATMSGVPRGTVASRYSRATRALRDRLTAGHSGDPDFAWLTGRAR